MDKLTRLIINKIIIYYGRNTIMLLFKNLIIYYNLETNNNSIIKGDKNE